MYEPDKTFLTAMTKVIPVHDETPKTAVDDLSERHAHEMQRDLNHASSMQSNSKPSKKSLRWTDNCGMPLEKDIIECKKPSMLVSIECIGKPSVSWITGAVGFGRLKFHHVPSLLTQREASRLPAFVPIEELDDPQDPVMKLSYKILGSDCPLVRAALASHGFREAGPTQTDWNILWSSSKIEHHELRTMNR
jgi:hypothetical protein